MEDSVVAVALGNGLVVWHTRKQWEALMRGTDREAIEGMRADLDEYARSSPRGPHQRQQQRRL